MSKVVTLCGSTKFKEAFERMEKQLTLENKIVLSVGFFEKIDGTTLTSQQLEMLAELHKEKIRMSDGIYVVNEGGYIGESTRKEIEFAKIMGKDIEYME